MDTLHIGGIADGDTLNLPETIDNGHHSFKHPSDFASDSLRYHEYELRRFMVRRSDGIVEEVELMVWNKLSKSEVKSQIESRLNVMIEQ